MLLAHPLPVSSVRRYGKGTYTESKGQVSLFFRTVDYCKLELVNPRFSLMQSENHVPRTVIKILLGEAGVLGMGTKTSLD